MNSKYRTCEVTVTFCSLKLCCFGVLTSWFWASLFNFDVSAAIYCCIFVIFIIDTYIRISSIQKTVVCLGKAEQINLWSKACVKNSFFFNSSKVYTNRDLKKKKKKVE